MSTVEEILNAVRELPPHEQAEVKRRLEGLLADPDERQAPAETQQAGDLDQRIQRALYDAGLISEIKPRVKRPRERRPPIKIKGKPLSETIIEDRR
ncbi:MAG: hypothetical protein H0W34_12825 [Pyrinomonadaceae bacterium]|nr:hypothetical protein [Pyrinomonadaceae bacterium]MBA3572823.1 hypothetical protein [Pyrinomonadaceae bacterium]